MRCSFFHVLFMLCLVFSSNQALAFVPLDFDQQHNARLDGLWNYYPNEFLFDNEIETTAQLQSTVVHLPNSLQLLSGEKNGFATFQQHFRLPQSALGQQVYFYIPYQYGAYQLFVNGRLIAQVGKVGSKARHQTKMAPKLASFFATNQDIVISIQVSSFDHIRGGLENPIYIGLTEPILHKFYRQVVPLCVVSGMLLMVGSFMLLFGIYRRYQGYFNNALIYLALFILCFSLRSFFAVPFIYTLFTDISWLWGTRAEYLLTQFSCLFFIIYVHKLDKQLINNYIYYISAILVVSTILVTLTQQPLVFQSYFFKAFLFSLFFFANLIYAILLIFKNKKPYSKLNAFAILLLCLTFLHDYLLGLGLIDSIEIAFYSSCIYFICVTFQLSHDYANQSIKTVKLNKRLVALNKDLDQKVLERTQTVLDLNKQLELQVRTDALTGTYNRHALNIEIQQRYEDAVLKHKKLAFFMLDIDFFKNYNDLYGHLKGDEILKYMVAALKLILPEGAFLARYGGEEFAILISDVDANTSTHLAERWLEYIRDCQWVHLGRKDNKKIVTVSAGVAVMDAKHRYKDVYALMKAADERLYRAKAQRDCVCSFKSADSLQKAVGH